MIPESQHFEALCHQPSITINIVLLLLCMMSAIQLDYEFLFQTDEIHEEWSNRTLPAKLMTIHLAHSQMAPEKLLSIGHVAPKLARSLDWRWQLPPS